MLGDTGAVFLGGAALLWVCAGIYAARFLRSDPRPASFALFWNLVLAGNLGVFVAADIVSFYVFFALVSLMAYPLVIHDRKPASLRAGTAYIVLAVIGETGLLAAVRTGAVSMHDSQGRPAAVWGDNLARIEALVRDRASIAVVLLVVMGALLAAFLS